MDVIAWGADWHSRVVKHYQDHPDYGSYWNSK
jgi:hypothetical protein